MVGLDPAKEPPRHPSAGWELHRRVLQGRHPMLVLAAGARQAIGPRPEPMDLQGIGRIADAFPQGADQAPGITPAHGLILPRGQHPTPVGVGQRGVVEVLADVVLVEAHRAVMGQGQVLCVDQVQGGHGIAGIFQGHMPEPGRRRLRQDQRDGEANVLPGAGQRQTLAVKTHLRWTARAEQGDGLGHRAKPAEIQVRRTALYLVAQEQIDNNVLVIETADGAVVIHLHPQPGGAFEADGRLVWLAVFMRHGVTLRAM